jgi:tRNA C32,U32 (ribose-2'-O)-methylase TrmJ
LKDLSSSLTPTQEERQQLMAELNLKDSQGLIDPSDKIIIMSCTNLKQAAELLAYKIKKRQEQMQQMELQKIQQQSQGNAQVAQMSEQMKQQTAQMQAQLDAQLLQMEKQWDFEIEKMKKMTDLQSAQVQVDGRTLGHEIQAMQK